MIIQRYVENFMKLMFEIPTGPYKASPVVIEALNKLFILHADHEQNCSTSTVRMVGSSHAGLFASISSGVSALWGLYTEEQTRRFLKC
jgi:citrate synthase